MVEYPFYFPFKVHLDFEHSVVLEAFMLEYTVFFPVLSTLTWDTLLTLRSTWGFYLNHLIPLRPFKTVFNNVLLEHGGLPHVHKILVSAPVPLELILTGLWLGLGGLGFGTRLDNFYIP